MRYNIDRIISEEINKYLYKDALNENAYFEKASSSGLNGRGPAKKSSDTKKSSDNNSKQSKSDDLTKSPFSTAKDKGTEQFADHLADLNQNGQLNIRKLASELTGIPTSTKSKENVNKLNTAQSHLRKEIYGLKAPSGDKYGLTRGKAAKISSELSL